MKHSILAALAAGTFLILVGCADQDSLPPLEFESARARIGVTRAELAPCADELALIDTQMAFVEERMGLSARSRIDVFVMDIDELPCGDGIWGCYRGDEDHVYSPWFAMEHELSHAALRGIEFPSTFWREGSAELLAGVNGTRRDPNATLTAESFGADDLPNYAEATHFQRYLVETRGWESYRELVRGGFDLEAVYGLTPGELAAEYESDAPAGYPPLDVCDDPQLEATEEGAWQLEVTFSCSTGSQLEGGSFSNDVGAAIRRTVHLDAGTYEVRQDGGSAMFIEGCWVDVLDEIPSEVPSSGDVPNQVDQAGGGFEFEANETHTLALAGGIYHFSLSSGTESEATVALTVRRIQ